MTKISITGIHRIITEAVVGLMTTHSSEFLLGMLERTNDWMGPVIAPMQEASRLQAQLIMCVKKRGT